MSEARRPRISICVGTTMGWPTVEPCLRSFLGEARETEAEILIADGSGRPPPEDPDILSAVSWRSMAGASIFRLVESNVRSAEGEIVALTEDHCTVRPGWVRAILRAHAEFPQAAAVGGAIENPATDGSRLLWASHLMTQGAHMAPLPRGPSDRIGNEANISFKRWALEGVEPDPIGFLTIHHARDLADRGEMLVNDDRIVVDHHESFGVRDTAVVHFDDGRTIAGFRRSAMNRADWLRVLGAPLLPLYRTARVVRSAVAKGRARTALAALPWLIILEYCHGAGELLGYLRGPGRSPHGLR